MGEVLSKEGHLEDEASLFSTDAINGSTLDEILTSRQNIFPENKHRLAIEIPTWNEKIKTKNFEDLIGRSG